MKADEAYRDLANRMACVVANSNAHFGLLFDVIENGARLAPALVMPGAIKDPEVIRRYLGVGERAHEILKAGEDQAVLCPSPEDADSPKLSWFAAIVTQRLPVSVCAVAFYPFYDKGESVRILRLIEMALGTL